jgi:hypothetical protein
MANEDTQQTEKTQLQRFKQGNSPGAVHLGNQQVRCAEPADFPEHSTIIHTTPSFRLMTSTSGRM